MIQVGYLRPFQGKVFNSDHSPASIELLGWWLVLYPCLIHSLLLVSCFALYTEPASFIVHGNFPSPLPSLPCEIMLRRNSSLATGPVGQVHFLLAGWLGVLSDTAVHCSVYHTHAGSVLVLIC